MQKVLVLSRKESSIVDEKRCCVVLDAISREIARCYIDDDPKEYDVHVVDNVSATRAAHKSRTLIDLEHTFPTSLIEGLVRAWLYTVLPLEMMSADNLHYPYIPRLTWPSMVSRSLECVIQGQDIGRMV